MFIYTSVSFSMCCLYKHILFLIMLPRYIFSQPVLCYVMSHEAVACSGLLHLQLYIIVTLLSSICHIVIHVSAYISSCIATISDTFTWWQLWLRWWQVGWCVDGNMPVIFLCYISMLPSNLSWSMSLCPSHNTAFEAIFLLFLIW